MKIRINRRNYSLARSFQFSGGEVQIRLPKMIIQEGDTIYISTLLNSPNAIMEMLLVDDALHRNLPKNVKTVLEVYYMPYARQDRVCYEGEAYSSKVMQKLLEGTQFNFIRFADLHSYQAMPDRFVELSQLDIFKYNPSILDNVDVIVSPDAGATDKAKAIGEWFNLPISQSEKVRNTDTGELANITIDLSVDIKNKNVMIVDDICDGGGTFCWTAKELKKFEPTSISLYITHGIFSKGTDCLFAAGISHVVTTDSFYVKTEDSDRRIEVISL